MTLKSFFRLPALALSLLALPAAAQNSGYLTASAEKVVAKRGSTVDAKVDCTVQAGYHVNSNKPSDEYLIPLSLKWTAGAVHAGEVVFPKPSFEKYTFSEKPLSVFTGKFQVITKVQVPATTPVGPAVLAGKLRYQACNDKMCFPPKTIDISLPVQVQ